MCSPIHTFVFSLIHAVSKTSNLVVQDCLAVLSNGNYSSPCLSAHGG